MKFEIWACFQKFFVNIQVPFKSNNSTGINNIDKQLDATITVY